MLMQTPNIQLTHFSAVNVMPVFIKVHIDIKLFLLDKR